MAWARHPWEGADPHPCLGSGSTRNGGPYTGSQNSPGVGVPLIKQRGRLQPREVRERGVPRLGRSGGRVLPLPPVTEAAPLVTTPEGQDHHWSKRQDLS